MANPEFGVVRGRYRIVEGVVERAAVGAVVFAPAVSTSYVDPPGETLYARAAVTAVLSGDGWVHVAGSPAAYVTLPVGWWQASFSVKGMDLAPFMFELTAGQVVILPSITAT